jgi:DNA-binding transcriptional LysR family regulator
LKSPIDSRPHGPTDNTSHSSANIVEFPRKRGSSFPTLVGRLRFKHLLLLAALDEHRNIRRAADTVHLAQPSATKLIHDLERDFGFQLFDRLPRGMLPTALGVEVLAFARRALGDLKRFASDLDTKQAGRGGQLVIGTTMDVASEILGRALGELKQCHPNLSVRVLGETSDQMIACLLKGETDMALGYLSALPESSGIECETIGKEALSMVVRTHHPLCRKNKLSFSELERAVWIVPPIAHSMCPVIEQCLAGVGIRAPSNIVESNSVTATLGLLLSSDAIAILPEPAVRGHIRANLLIRLPISVGEYSAEFGILSRRGEELTSAAAEFSQLVRKFGGGFISKAKESHETNLIRSKIVELA